ncbi:MAG: glycoside hydrolase family 73 protein [Saprospiraceae bacterium]
MKKQKFSNIPMDIIDTNFQELAKAEQPSFASRNRLPDLELKTLLLMVFQQLAVGLRKPMLALKYQLKELLQRFPQLKKLPWLKLSIVALAAFVLFEKDMQFNFAMKSPLPIFSDEDDNRPLTNAQTSIAQTVAMKSGTENPYAPAEPMSLRDRQVRDFVRSYSELAIKEMHLSGVPASITIGQALIESRCGLSRLAKKNNNFFGIKCFSKKCPKGHCTNATDDHHKDFFRKYNHANKSFRHHSQILTQGRYKHLSSYGKDYKAWSKGLKKAGYATDKTYDKKLIKIIETYKLYDLDKM